MIIDIDKGIEDMQIKNVCPKCKKAIITSLMTQVVATHLPNGSVNFKIGEGALINYTTIPAPREEE